MKKIPYLRIENDEVVEDEAFAFESVWLKGNGFNLAKDLPTLIEAIKEMPVSFLTRTKELLDANLQSDTAFDLSKGIFYPPTDLYGNLQQTSDFNLLFSPMEQSDLYRTFLKVDENRPETGLRFIKRYGTLGFGNHFNPGAYGRFGSDIEPWDYFRTQLADFKQLVETYKILKEEKIGKKLSHKLYLAFKLMLNKGLERVTPCLINGHNDEDRNEDRNLDSRFLPGYHCPTLLSVIYLQFYLDITNPNGSLRQCGHCLNWFIVGTGSLSGKGKRSDSKYCTKSCQDAHMQARKRASDKRTKQEKGR